MSLKNSNDTIGNPTRDLPVCGAMYFKLYNHVYFHGRRLNQGNVASILECYIIAVL